MMTFACFFRRTAILLILPLTALAAPELGRVYGLAGLPEGALIAAERGLFVVQADGRMTPRSQPDAGIVALATSPAASSVIYAGTRKGVQRSTDGGRSWQRTSQDGPEVLRLLALSPDKPDVMFGVADALYRSGDSGRTWRQVGPAPEKIMSLAVSARDADVLYAGTMKGVMISRDGGVGWLPASLHQIPATLVSVERDGELYGFSWGQGFVRAREPQLTWTPVNNRFGGQAVMRLARNGKHLFASTNAGKVFVSADRGANWRHLTAASSPSTPAIRRGEKLFSANCQACHGEQGIGESPQFGAEQPSLAPALDDTAHAWHHTDEQIKKTILKGLPDPSRMKGWGDRLTEHDAEDLVAYMKSLWTPRALACQGPKHMDPSCQN